MGVHDARWFCSVRKASWPAWVTKYEYDSRQNASPVDYQDRKPGTRERSCSPGSKKNGKGLDTDVVRLSMSVQAWKLAVSPLV